jgi:hypothetical protein
MEGVGDLPNLKYDKIMSRTSRWTAAIDRIDVLGWVPSLWL